jgi:hypothetical protein
MMRTPIIALFGIAVVLLGETQVSRAQSPHSYPWCAVYSRRGGGFHVLLLHELGTVQDNNVWHRRELRPKPVLPCATDAAAAPLTGETTLSQARQ